MADSKENYKLDLGSERVKASSSNIQKQQLCSRLITIPKFLIHFHFLLFHFCRLVRLLFVLSFLFVSDR